MASLSWIRRTATPPAPSDAVRLATGLEAVAFFASILLFIWQWQRTYPHLWIALFALMLAAQWLHGDTPATLGLTFGEFRAAGSIVWPLMLAFYLPLAIYGFSSGRLHLLGPGLRELEYFAGYAFWCVCQQYLTQSYFNNRLMEVFRNRHASSLLVGIMFGATHIPNPILMAATTIAGFIFAEIFARHRSIWPLALAQAVGGILVATITPACLIHNMRVGPGYLFWHIR